MEMYSLPSSKKKTKKKKRQTLNIYDKKESCGKLP